MKLEFNGTLPEIVKQVADFLANVNVAHREPDMLAQVPASDEPIKPVLTQAQIEDNLAREPEHTLPPQPTLEEVRAALKDLRDKHGSKAVKDLLRAFNAESVPDLKPDHYLAVLETAVGGGVA